jgi:ABC-2 type transport system ATP-binding protein
MLGWSSDAALGGAVERVIGVRGLRKRYGEVVAVDDLDLEVGAGEVFALLGPNGAGKTTTVEILEGYRRRDAGEVRVLGEDPSSPSAAWRSRIGIVPQSTGVFEELTVQEIVHHFALFYPNPLHPDDVIDLVGLGEQRGRRGAKLSGGQKRRLDVALGVVGNPELIFLDEPTTGLDPVGRRQAWGLVSQLTALGKTVLLTTHYLDEAEALADRVGVIAGGRLVEVATPRELGGRARAKAQVSFKAEGPLAGRPLPQLPDATVETAGGIVTVQTGRPTQVVAALSGWAAAAGADELPELTVIRPSLEDVYLPMIAAHGAAPTEPVRGGVA